MGDRRKKLFGETYRGDCRTKSFWENQGFLERQLSPLRHRVVERMWISRPLVTPKQKGAEGFAYLFLFPTFPKSGQLGPCPCLLLTLFRVLTVAWIYLSHLTVI